LGKYLIDENTNRGSNDTVGIGTSIHPEDFDVLLNHPDFEDHMERCYTINKFAKLQSLILRKRIVEILHLLNQELKKA
jgi:hypothetical protein